jgi:CRISPR/Cas system-associated protein Cas10 (large subunit of type III CRISPR-Cas system)|tara:strand:- start:148 stop:390 length:243 start_codon:yes stop_codon:yes gene_type:complete
MPRKESTINLTLDDVGIHSDLRRCVVCDKSLMDYDKVVLMDIFNMIAGWICPHCASLYDYNDNLIDIGDLDVYSEIKGYA